MDSSVSPKDEIWFLRVCHHISNAVYYTLDFKYPQRRGEGVRSGDLAGHSLGALRPNHHSIVIFHLGTKQCKNAASLRLARYVLTIRYQDVGCRNKAPPPRRNSAHVYAETSRKNTGPNATTHRTFWIVLSVNFVWFVGCYEASTEDSVVHPTLQMKLILPLKTVWREKFFCAALRCYTHSRNWTGLLKCSGYNSWTDCML